MWSGWRLFFLLGTVWLTLPTFYSPVALSRCRSSRGNVLICSPDPSLPRLESGYSHYPPPPAHTQKHCAPPPPPFPWQLAWLLLLTAAPPHCLPFLALIHVCLRNQTNLYLKESVFFFICCLGWCHITFCFPVLTSAPLVSSSVWCHCEKLTQAVLC